MRRAILPIILLAILAFLLVTSGPPPPTPNPPGTFSFAVLGDAPYYKHEEWQHRIVRKDIDAHDLVSVIHVGDIFWRPCSDAMMEKSHRQLDALRHPVIYTPGDNEWADCWEPRVGGYVPLERLARLRRTFYSNPTRSMGRNAIALAAQNGFPENARWRTNDVLFATVHLIGALNGREPFPGRTGADDAASVARTEAAAVWARETFALARTTNARAVVLGLHTNPGFAGRESAREYRKLYEPFITTLEQEAAAFRKPVLIVQGDLHIYIADHPVPAAPNLARLQVPGSPLVGWVRVTVNLEAKEPFAFEEYVVPKWKYW